MKKIILTLIFTLASLWSFAVTKGELSLSAQNSISKMERAIQSARKTAQSELTILMKKEMQSGNLEKAMTLNNIIKALATEKPSVITEPKSKSKYEDDIAGTWEFQRSKTKITFNPDYSCTTRSPRQVNRTSTWKIDCHKLLVTNSMLKTTDTYDLPPKKITHKRRTVTSLQGKTDSGDARMLTK